MSDDDATDYEELLPDARNARTEWFWGSVGGFIGLAAAGAATMWAGVPNWHLLVTGALGYVCCAVVVWRVGVP